MISEDELKTLFDQADKEHHGEITFAEFAELRVRDHAAARARTSCSRSFACARSYPYARLFASVCFWSLLSWRTVPCQAWKLERLGETYAHAQARGTLGKGESTETVQSYTGSSAEDNTTAIMVSVPEDFQGGNLVVKLKSGHKIGVPVP